jgi:uncharacterized protein YegP (UPF0339 family)
MVDKVYVYKDAADEWRWRRVATNGNIVSTSGEGYKNNSDCQDMAFKLNPGAEVVVSISSADKMNVESQDVNQ